VLTFNDSIYSRACNKAVELLAKVHDYATGKYVKGLRLLTMGWSGGNNFIPVAFLLLSSRKEKNRYFPVRAGNLCVLFRNIANIRNNIPVFSQNLDLS